MIIAKIKSDSPGAVSQSEGELAMRRRVTQKTTGVHLTLLPASIFQMSVRRILWSQWVRIVTAHPFYTKTGGTKTRKAPKISGWGRNPAFPQVRATDSLCIMLQRAVTSLGETQFWASFLKDPQISFLHRTHTPLVGGGRMTQSLHRLSVTSLWYILSGKAECIHVLW